MRDQRGQAVTELALVLPIFLLILVGLFDLGRGIYASNALSGAARDLARTTSVHPGVSLGSAPEVLEVASVQLSLVPGLRPPSGNDFECVDVVGAVQASAPCSSGMFVRVTVRADYAPVAFLGIAGPMVLSATSSARIP